MRCIILIILLCGCVRYDQEPTIVDRYVATADEFFGLHEVENREELTEFLEYDPAVYAWCAAFVNAIFREYGIEQTGSLLARSFLSWGEPVDEPQYGDLVIFKRGDEGWQGHLGFFIRRYGNSYLILGGNQDDRVTYDFYPISDVLGIRRLKE
jgi:uncharacterized protein (TIGR02594 family)